MTKRSVKRPLMSDLEMLYPRRSKECLEIPGLFVEVRLPPPQPTPTTHALYPLSGSSGRCVFISMALPSAGWPREDERGVSCFESALRASRGDRIRRGRIEICPSTRRGNGIPCMIK